MPRKVTKNIIIKGHPADVYRQWADFTSFPRFMQYIKSVTMLDDNTSHWVMQGPLGTTIEWDAETTRLEPTKRIGWSSKDRKGTITTSGEVVFAPLPQDRTEVTVTLQYVPPAGMAGEAVARLFANPEKRLQKDLRNFKNMFEKTELHTPT